MGRFLLLAFALIGLSGCHTTSTELDYFSKTPQVAPEKVTGLWSYHTLQERGTLQINHDGTARLCQVDGEGRVSLINAKYLHQQLIFPLRPAWRIIEQMPYALSIIVDQPNATRSLRVLFNDNDMRFITEQCLQSMQLKWPASQR